jgi:hypothetical protein
MASTYTYSDNPATVPLDEARLLISDMGTSDDLTEPLVLNAKFGCLVSDEVINYYILKYPENIYRTCIHIMTSVISGLQGGNQRYKTILKQKTGDLENTYGASAGDSMKIINTIIDNLKAQELQQYGLAVDGLSVDLSCEVKEGFSTAKLSIIEPMAGIDNSFLG